MFESIEIRKVENGFVVSVNTEDGTKEHIFGKIFQVFKFIKTTLNDKSDE